MVKLRKYRLEFCKLCGDPMQAKSIKREFCSSLCRARNFMAIRKGLKESEQPVKIEEKSDEFFIQSGSSTYTELREKLLKK